MATVSGGTPTTTNGFCSPAFDRKGVEQRVAIAPTATRLRMIGGIDIILLSRESGQLSAYGLLQWRVWEGEVRYCYATLPLFVPLFRRKPSGDKMVGRGSRIARDSSRRGALYLRCREARPIRVPSRGYDARTTARRAYRSSGSGRPESLAALVTSRIVQEPRPTSDYFRATLTK
jgi:hypothetical protein